MIRDSLQSIAHIAFAVFIMCMTGEWTATAQTTTQVTISGIPQTLPSPYISDFERNIRSGNYQVMAVLSGPGTAPVNIRFRVRLTLDGEILLNETSIPTTLQPGGNSLTPFPDFVLFDISLADVLNKLPSSRVRQAWQTGSFPEGNYTLSIEPLSATTGMQTGPPGIATFRVLFPQPPILIAPSNRSLLAASMSVPVFSWSPVMGPPGSMFEYEFLLVQLFEGQNPGDALLSNREHAQMTVNTNILPYTPDNLPLEVGERYAWQVTARDINGEIPVKNQGQSNIHTFTFGETDEDEEGDQDGPLFALMPEIQFTELIPVTTISGNVRWRFSPSEGAQGADQVNPSSFWELADSGIKELANGMDDPNYQIDPNMLNGQSVYGTTLQNSMNQGVDTPAETSENQLNNSVVPVFGGGTSNNTQVGSFSDAPVNIQNQLSDIQNVMSYHSHEDVKVNLVHRTEDGRTQVLASANTNENGSFQLMVAPSELANLIQEEEESNPSGNLQSLTNFQEFDASAAQQQQTAFANLSVTVTTVYIEVQTPHFAYEDKSVIVSTASPGNYDAGTIYGTALTYRLQPQVIDGETDGTIEDAVVEIYRKSDWYDQVPALREEGFPLSDEERGITEIINGRSYTKLAQINTGDQITRLFSRKLGPMDQYHVKVTARGYNTIFTPMSASARIDPGDVVIINRTYSMQEAPPLVEGRVVRRDTQAPIPNITVALMAAGAGAGGLHYLDTTDDDGRFVISNIVPREDPYTLIVDGPQISAETEELILNANGQVVTRDPIMVDPTLVPVAGKVINDKGLPVNNATVRWTAGGNPVQTDQYGRFVTANTIGTHELSIRKIGHRDEQVTVTISDPDNTEYTNLYGGLFPVDASGFGSGVGKFANSLNNTSSFQIGETEKNDPGYQGFNAGGLGFSGDVSQSHNLSDAEIQNVIDENNLNMTLAEFSNLASYLANLAGNEGSPTEDVQDIGSITINRAVGKLDVTVLAEGTGDPVENATVRVGSGETEGTTGTDGSIYFEEAPGGTVPVQVIAPSSTNYVPVITEVTITDNGDITYVDISLEMGGRATGVVTAAGSPVEDATVRLEGREDISVKTAGDGSYILPGIPVGEWTLRVSKSGYVGTSESAVFSENEDEIINFSLQDSEFDIATLMGFDIEVDELSVSPSDTTISGAFVSLSSNELLTVDGGLRIPFSNINVFEEGGVLKPVGGEVQTDASEIKARLFDFLIVKIKSSDGVIARERQIPSSIGYIAGKVEIDYASTYTSATGWRWPSNTSQFLKLPNVSDLPDGVGEEELVTITSDGSFPFPDIGVPDFELNFGTASETLELFGFDVTLNLTQSVLRNDGFYMRGDVSLAELPLFDEASITLEQLWIGTDGAIREASLELDPTPALAFAGWKMELLTGTLSEIGFALGGNLEFAIPGSDPSEISFSDLSISPDQLFGGQFTLPSSGIDVFGIVDLQAKAGTDISFGKVQNQDVYFITGAANINLPKYVDKSLEFRNFMVRTDGQFNANIAANFEADFFGLADLTVTGVEFRNTSAPSIYIDGRFGLRAIPMINAQAGGLTYQRGGNVSFDEIDLSFDIGAIGQAGVGIGLVDTPSVKGFSGNGSLEISGTPINAGIAFSYESVPGGISFGADFMAGIPPIPVGSFSIEQVGGGFGFNTSNNKFRVTVRGMVTAAPGTGSAIALDPLEVTVRSGPVIEGFAALSVMEQQIADADLLIDFPNRLFDIEARVGFDALDDVNVNVNGASRIVLSAAPNDTYWMLGVRFNAEMLGLFQANANILAAWALNTNAHPEYNEYTSFVREDFRPGGVISGIHLDVGTEFGIPKSDQKCVDFAVGKACAYFWNSTRCQINADFGGGNFGFYLGSDWAGGGSVTLLGANIAGADIQASGSISGSYINNVWAANGRVSGSVSGYIGDCRVGCQTKFCWPSCGLFSCPIPKGASLCVSAAIEVDYRSNRGIQVSLDL